MADSIAPVTVTGEWTNLYDLTGFDAGTPLIVYCEVGSVRAAIASTQPSSDIVGTEMHEREEIKVDGDQAAVWVRAQGPSAILFVQEDGGCIRRHPFYDNRTVNGSQATTTQPFTELNSKRGNQFEVAMLFTSITALTGLAYFGFETGDNPVILKQRDVYGPFINARYDVFKDATYSGGTAVTAFNNNDLVVNTGDVTIVTGPTVTNVGTVFGPTTALIGSEGVGNRLVSTFGGAAGEKILAPNTKYLVRVSNLDVGAIALLAVRLYYYEGPIGLFN